MVGYEKLVVDVVRCAVNTRNFVGGDGIVLWWGAARSMEKENGKAKGGMKVAVVCHPQSV